MLPAQNVLSTWVGPATGNWRVADNWDTGIIPEEAGLDALVDGNPAQNSIVTYELNGNRTNGFITVESGDSLTFVKKVSGSVTLTSDCIINQGELILRTEAWHNSQSTTIISLASNTVFNAAGATLEILGNHTSRNRASSNYRVPVDNTNEGTILVREILADRNGVRFQLSGSGTFVNNGLIQLLIYGAPKAGSNFANMQFTAPENKLTSSILGTGRIFLDLDDSKSPSQGTLNITSEAKSHTITNGPLHTIEGTGTIALNLVNQGLIRSIGTNGTLSVQNYSIAEGGTPIINLAEGRIIANSPRGIFLGSTSSGPSRFLNEGLLEARAGSSISFREKTTAGTSKNTPASTLVLSGTLAGGGTFINNYRPIELSETATLAPGDLENLDGTGASTAGLLSFTSNLIVRAGSTLNYQLGRPTERGATYDSVAVDNALTLAGELHLSTLPGFGTGGSYTLFTCAPGALTDNGLTLASYPPEVLSPTLTVDPELGTVTLEVAPTWTLILLH